MTGNLRILHLDTGREWRGGQRQVLLLMQALRARGHESFGAFRPEGPLARAAREAGFRVLPFHPRSEWDLPGARALSRHLRALRPDVLHAQDGHAAALALLAARHTVPVVASRRVAFLPRGNPVSRLKLTSISRWIALSAAAESGLLRRGVDARRIDRVPSAVVAPPTEDPTGFQPPALRERLGLAAEVFLIVSGGRLEPLKGQRTLLEACSLARDLAGSGNEPAARPPGASQPRAESQPPARWLIAGAGPDLPYLRLLTRRLRLDSAVLFPGQIADLPLRLGEAQVCVLASYMEGLGGFLLDAMAAGVPVVATDTGGVPEVVRDGVEGFLVPAGEAGALAEAVRRLYLDPSLRRRMGEAGRRRAREFSIEATVEGTLTSYRKAVQEHGIRRSPGRNSTLMDDV